MEKILITGASSGIGKELAKKLANKSKKLFLVARSIDKLNFLKKELMIVIYSYNKFPAIIYNSKFLKFLGDNNIELSHDIYTFERKI